MQNSKYHNIQFKTAAQTMTTEKSELRIDGQVIRGVRAVSIVASIGSLAVVTIEMVANVNLEVKDA